MARKSLYEQKFAQYLTKEMGVFSLKLKLLTLISAGEVYPYQMIKEIEGTELEKYYFKNGLKSVVYGTLTDLEKSGFVSVDTRVENNKVKKYYALTKTGSEAIVKILKNMEVFLKDVEGAWDAAGKGGADK